MNCVRAEEWFSGERPALLPGEAPAPDFNALVTRAGALNCAHHPLDDLAAILTREHSRLDAPQSVLSTIGAIDDATVFVVAGQQAGLFGGPLYTFYKALHAVRLARRLAEASGLRVIPLFWIASDDHDIREVGRHSIRGRDGTPLTMHYASDSMLSDAPLGEVVLDSGITAVVDELAGHLPPGDFAERFVEGLREDWTPGLRWTDAFARQMLRYLGRTGLVLFDPRWEGVKRLLAPIFTAELTEPRASAELVNKAAEGFATSRERRAAIHRPDGATNLFVEVDGARLLLTVDERGFNAGGHHFESEDLLALVEREPERFSPAAALRPVCQDMLFPVASLICGPGERHYLKQVEPLYGFFDVDGATVWPRASFTIVDARTARAAKKGGVPVTVLFGDSDTVRARLASTTFPQNIEQELETFEKAVESHTDVLARSLAKLDGSLDSWVEARKGRILHVVHEIGERARRAHRAMEDSAQTRLVTAAAFLVPEGIPQERFYGMDSVLSFLQDDSLDMLLDLTSPDEEFHRIIVPA